MENQLAIKRNEVWIYALTCMKPENMLYESGQTLKTTYCIIPL